VLGVANGEFATVIAVDDRNLRLLIDNRREISAAIGRLMHIDYGYASTAHSSQGATVDRVIANVDTLRSAEIVNRKQFYVSISRARYSVTVYTDDRSRLDLALAAISKSRSRWSGCMLQVDTNWHWFTINRAALVGISMGCGDEFRPGPANPSATLRCARRRSGSASFVARSRGPRRRSRSASRRCGGGARFTGTARHRLSPDASLGTPCSVLLRASRNLARALGFQ
jgi:hypothetical protein